MEMAHQVKKLPAERRVGSLGWEDPPEKEMAIHSSIFAWRILWSEEPGVLQSIGSQDSDTTKELSTHIQWKYVRYIEKKLPTSYNECIHTGNHTHLETHRIRTVFLIFVEGLLFIHYFCVGTTNELFSSFLMKFYSEGLYIL